METRRLPISGHFTSVSSDCPSDVHLPMCMYLLGQFDDICLREHPKCLKVVAQGLLHSIHLAFSCLQMTRTVCAFLAVMGRSQGCRQGRRTIYDISTRSTEFSLS